MTYRRKDPRSAETRIAEVLERRLAYDAAPGGSSPQTWLEPERALSAEEHAIYQAMYREAKGLPPEPLLTDEEREARKPKPVAWFVPAEDAEDDGILDLTHL